MDLSVRKAGKQKGETVRTYRDEDWFKKAKSKYRKTKPNRFNKQKRFLSQLDMAEAKRMESITNSRIKRGEIKKGNFGWHYVCGCGVEGCVGHSEHNTTN